MRGWLFILGFGLALPAMAASDTDYTRSLPEPGYKYCSSAINQVANWLVGQAASSFGIWSTRDADSHISVLTASKRYPDGSGLMHLSTLRSPAGGCDVSFNLTVTTDKPCDTFRDTAFKSWNPYGGTQAIPILSDPNANNVQVAIQPLGTGCVVNKMGVMFIDPEKLKSIQK